MTRKTLIILGLFLIVGTTTASLYFTNHQSKMSADTSTTPQLVKQTNFSGGPSDAVHEIIWSNDLWSSESWNKYNSLTGASFSAPGTMTITSPQVELVSSIFYSSAAIHGYFNDPASLDQGTLSFRSGKTLGTMSGWRTGATNNYCISDRRYIQFKVSYNVSAADLPKTQSVELTLWKAGGMWIYGGVYDDNSKKGLPGATISGTPVSIYDSSTESSAGTSGIGDWVGGYQLHKQWDSSISSYTIKVSKPGYQTQTRNLSVCSELSDVDFFLSPISDSPTSSTTSTTPAPKPTIKKSTVAPRAAAPPAKPPLTLSSLTKLGSKTPPQVITTPATTTPVLRTDQSFTLSGTTSANAKITLTIQSDPITTEVTADKDGKWSYLLNPKTLNLKPGSHTITAYATDSAGVKSDTVELTKFTLKDPVQAVKPLTPEPYNYYSIINIVSAILILAALGFLILRIINKRKANIQPIVSKEGI